MSARRILSVPVSGELDHAVRLAASREGATVAAWVRERLLTALRHPAAPGPPLSKADERKIWRLMSLPQLYTAETAGFLLNVSPDVIRRKLRKGELVGHREHRAVWDPSRRRFLRRERWRIGADELWTHIARRNEYRLGYGRRPYSRRPADQAPPAVAAGNNAT